jgi:CRP/FNR family cyclic AMP-dependent transcriptional regulator
VCLVIVNGNNSRVLRERRQSYGPTRCTPSRAAEGTEKSLKANFLFREQPDDVVAELENLCEWFWCPAGEQIFDRDDTDAEVFFLVDGLARVGDHAQSGQKIAFSDLEAGTVFGELSAIDGAERSATVYTVEGSILAVVPAPAFVAYLKR